MLTWSPNAIDIRELRSRDFFPKTWLFGVQHFNKGNVRGAKFGLIIHHSLALAPALALAIRAND